MQQATNHDPRHLWSARFDRLAEYLRHLTSGEADAMVTGNSSTLNVTLPSEREIVMTRTFDAPRALVFEAFSKPEHISHWWGPAGATMPVCDMDFRPGGKWRYVTHEADGNDYGFHGEFREIVPPERIVWTFEFEGMPGHVSVETMAFNERDGKTTITTTTLFDSVEDRDGMLQSGMETGAAESYNRLEAYLKSLA
jgi:uncharacterized protein YndB with AHSA1/START domain